MEDLWIEASRQISTTSTTRLLIGTVALLMISWFAFGKLFARNSGREPPMLPYWVPWHAFQAAMDVNSLLSDAKERFGVWSPFTLIILGRKVHIFKEHEEIAEIIRNRALDFSPFVLWWIHNVFGVSQAGVHQLRTGPHAQGLVYKAHLVFQKEIKPSVEPVTTKFLAALRTRIAEETQSKTVSCYRWTRNIAGIAAIRAIHGPVLVEELPNVMSVMAEYEDCFKSFSSGKPRFLAQREYAIRDTLVKAMKKTNAVEQAKGLNSDMAPFVTNRNRVTRESGLSEDDCATFSLGVLTATLTNLTITSFWMIAHIISDPVLKAKITTEIDALYVGNNSDPDLAKLFDTASMPILHALLKEVFRFYASSPTIRVAVENTKIGTYDIKKGSILLAPIRQTNVDSDVFGKNPEKFQSDRFLLEPELERSPYNRPYGGGIHKCPGRFLANREIFMFVAMMLRNFEFEAIGQIPIAEEGKYGSGMVTPEDMGEGFNMKISPRLIKSVLA
ncbi:cytochrome P450 [Geopyxis carbonaria]|nr:cytochrome P450 [Geopyxis carbonaria]